MKVLILPSVFPDTIADMYDEAYINSQLGKEVYVIDCNHSIGVCWHNLSSNKSRCSFCEKYRRMMRKKIPDSINIKEISSYIEIKDTENCKKLRFEYNTIQDIKRITYMGVNLGYCCLSIYISKTRNNSPSLDERFRTFFDHLLQQTALYTIAINKALDLIKPDYLYVFNGRCTNSRPGIELAKQKGVYYICSEVKTVFPGKKIRKYFHNAMPHSIQKNEEMVFDTWNHSTLDDNDKEYLGRRFFESKIKKVFGGDTNYTVNQEDNLMPDKWDDQKHNIVIFNSSEDEFSSIGDEYESKQLFNSQLVGIKKIAELLDERTDMHLYLKVHPNLNKIQYRYHLDLYKLEKTYKNITVIPGTSKISTYSMMARADKIIVFGSTAGLEAAYMKKPVILLCGAMYYNMGCCYVPHDISTLKELLFNKELKTCYNENVLKVGYYWMDYFLPTPTYFNIEKTNYSVKIMGRVFNATLYPYKKIFGSKVLCRLYENMIETIETKIHHAKYPIPYEEEVD